MKTLAVPIRRFIKEPYGFPISDSDIEQVVLCSKAARCSLGSVDIVQPSRNVEFGYFGRYDFQSQRVILYGHVQKGQLFVVGRKGQLRLSDEVLREKILDDVLPRQLGHHAGWAGHRDLSVRFAKDYAQRLKPPKEDLQWLYDAFRA